MNYWNGQKWSPSNPSFEIAGDAFVANQVQHQTSLASDLNQAGAVTITMPDGTTLRSTPVAIALYDAASGRSAVIATITNCAGTPIGSNSVLYPNAFAGAGVCADVLYRLKRGSFAQDVVFTGRLDPPEWGFPDDTTRIQIITEFYGAPEPKRKTRLLQVETNQAVRARMASPDLTDQMLGFGQAVLGPGSAYRASDQPSVTNALSPVAKEFTTVSGRSLLVESVTYNSVKQWLQSLPECPPSGRGAKLFFKKATTGYAAIPPPGLARKAAPSSRPQALGLARARSAALDGLVIDYLLEIGGDMDDPITFAGDSTWFIAGPVYCNGPVTIEGGTVFKYPTDPTAAINIYDGLTCQTQPYRPAIFTAGDDESIGASVRDIWPDWSGTIQGNGAYGGAGLNVAWAPTTTNLSNLRFLYLSIAVMSYAGGEGGTGLQISARDLQVLQCGSAFLGTYYYTVRNCLFWNNGCVFDCLPQDFAGETILCEQVTFHNCGLFIRDFTSIVCLTNCLVVLTPGLDTCYSVTTAASRLLSSDTGVFQSADAGSHYLPANSPYRALGTTAINPDLLASLKNKTTVPPIDLPTYMVMTGDVQFSPQIPRYTSGNPDLGYYYDAFDYAVAWVTSEGSDITVLPGTAIGFRNDFDPYNGWYTWIGFDLLAGSTFTCHGAATNQVTLAPICYAQEGPFAYTYMISFVPDYWPQATGWENVANTLSYLYGTSPLNMPVTLDGLQPPPAMDFRFTRFCLPAECSHFSSGWDWWWFWEWSPDSAMNLTLKDCALSGGWINIGAPDDYFLMAADNFYGQASFGLTNSLFDRVQVDLEPAYNWDTYMTTVGVDASFYAYNNLFHGGLLLIDPVQPSTGTWTWMDTLFDGTAFLQDQNQPFAWGYNAYWPDATSELGGALLAYWQPILQSLFWGMEPPWVPFDSSWNYLTSTSFTPTPGSGDQTLAAAPAYQTGPLGSFYLPTSSPLVNAGSRSPAGAGLYHYTTRTDQAKDAVQAAVNVGLHYVATTGAASTQPMDTDNDGIPDYVENWHGDGNYSLHTDTETDWHNAQTLSGTPDPLNTLYNNVDLDGDGMVGRIEKALSKNPLVPDNPLTLIPAASPGPNQVAFVVPVPFTTLAGIGSLSLRLDGKPVPFFRWDQDTSSGGCLLTWDTTCEVPGDYCAQVELYLNGQTRPGAMGPISPFTLTVDQAPYQYPLVSGTASWISAAPGDRLASGTHSAVVG